MLDLKKLSYFVSVAENNSFSRAAESLFISQSSLSQRIQELEQDLGVQLFVRANRSITITNAGRDLLERAKVLLLTADNLESYFTNELFRTKTSSSITLGIEKSFLEIPELLSAITDSAYALASENPGIKIRYELLNYTDCYGALSDGLADIVISDRFHSSDIENIKCSSSLIAKIPFCFAMKKQHNESTIMTSEDVSAMIESHPALLIHQHEGMSPRILEIIRQLGYSPKIYWLPTPQLTTLHVRSGHGYTILPSNHELIYSDDIKYSVLEACFHVYAVYQNVNPNTLIEPFMVELHEHLPTIEMN